MPLSNIRFNPPYYIIHKQQIIYLIVYIKTKQQPKMDIVMDLLRDNKDRLKPLGFFALTVMSLYGLNYLFKTNSSDQQDEQNKGNKRPAGIMNEGNTCFVNSLLQALSSVSTFKSNIETLLSVNVPSDDNQQLIIQLNKVIKKINSGSQSISVMDLLDILSRNQSQLINFQQQDTYQLYSAIVRAFDEFFNKRKDCNLSISQLTLKESEITNCLLGYTKSMIQCMTCKNTMTINVQSFYDLSLEIEPQSITSLRGALQWFQRKEVIQSYACTFCSVKNHIEKLERAKQRLHGDKWQVELSTVSEKLIGFLKKTSFEDMDLKEINQLLQHQVLEFKDIFQKIGDNSFRNQIFSTIKPAERNIVKQTKITKYPKVLVIHFKQLVINPYTGEPAYMRKPIDYEFEFQIQRATHNKVYKLTSLLTHIGNENMGHYFTFRRPSKDEDQWFLISDTHTERVSEQKVRRHIPYMLFYELDEENYDKDTLAKSLRQQEIQENQKQEDQNEVFYVNRLSQQLFPDEQPKKKDN